MNLEAFLFLFFSIFHLWKWFVIRLWLDSSNEMSLLIEFLRQVAIQIWIWFWYIFLLRRFQERSYLVLLLRWLFKLPLALSLFENVENSFWSLCKVISYFLEALVSIIFIFLWDLLILFKCFLDLKSLLFGLLDGKLQFDFLISSSEYIGFPFLLLFWFILNFFDRFKAFHNI